MPKTVVPTLFRSVSSLLFVLATAGCVVADPPPYEEYTLARAAIRAAQDVDSPRFSSGLWNRADENYRLGQRAYKEAEFGQAKQYFKKALDFAERAENATRLKKFQSGDSFP